MKKWYKSKTILFNLVCSGLIALEAALSGLSTLLPANWYAIICVILPVGNAMLRVITTSSISK